MADASFKLGFANWRSMLRRILGIRSDLPRYRNRAVRGIANDAELIFQAHAPRRSHRLARGIRAIPAGNVAVVIAHAEDPRTGYDYVGVTRFGHKVKRIKPTRKESRNPSRAPALQFAIGGQVIYRASTRGFKPKGDWAEAAQPEINKAADDVMEEFGRSIHVRWGSA